MRSRDPIDAVLAIIPARDEADRIEACIGAVDVALARLDVPQRLLVVVDDGSADGTGDVAASAIGRAVIPGVVHRVEARRASTARHAGVLRAAARTVAPPDRVLLLSTDADTVVPPGWADRHLDHARRGVQAVAGVVTLLRDPDGAALWARWGRDYLPTIAADGSHPHVHAANLSVRLDAYLAVGGFPRTRRAEDTALWRRLRRAGITPLADGGSVVATSARRQGRVPRGFAHALTTLYGADA